MPAGSLRAPVVAGVVLAALVAPLAAAGTGDTLREGVRNGTTARETEIVGDVARSTGPKGGYVTRQSNVSTGAEAGGAAIYGCRNPLTSTESCLRASNRAGGRAFEFATLGELAGRIEVGGGGDGAKPFTTNATGVATGLNADRVDGLEAEELRGGPGPAGPAGAVGPVGPAGADGADGAPGAAGEDATKLFVVYDPAQAEPLLHESGAERVDAATSYVVTFDRDVSACAPVATVYNDNGGFSTSHYVVVSQAPSLPRTISVAGIRRDTGAFVATGFSLAVFC